jgi:hypothetical protein
VLLNGESNVSCGPGSSTTEVLAALALGQASLLDDSGRCRQAPSVAAGFQLKANIGDQLPLIRKFLPLIPFQVHAARGFPIAAHDRKKYAALPISK